MILGHTFPVITDILSTPLPPGEFREELGFVAAEIDFDEAVGDENEVDGCIEFIAFGCGATARRIYVLIYHITTRPHIIYNFCSISHFSSQYIYLPFRCFPASIQ